MGELHHGLVHEQNYNAEVVDTADALSSIESPQSSIRFHNLAEKACNLRLTSRHVSYVASVESSGRTVETTHLKRGQRKVAAKEILMWCE